METSKLSVFLHFVYISQSYATLLESCYHKILKLLLKPGISLQLKEEDMKIIIILSAILAGLTGCSSSDDTPINELVGTWRIACEADLGGGGSHDISVTLTTTNGDVAFTQYSDANCQTVSMVENESFTYVLGSGFTLDGTVDGITTGAEFDNTNTTHGSSDFGITNYNSIAVVGTSLYIGDDEADPLKDASSPAARPTKLNPVPFIKQ